MDDVILGIIRKAATAAEKVKNVDPASDDVAADFYNVGWVKGYLKGLIDGAKALGLSDEAIRAALEKTR